MTDTARIERDIEAARARLEGTVNELAYRAQPQVIVQRQVQSLALRLNEATHTPEGDLRVERVAAVAAAVVGFIVVVGLIRQRRHR